MSELPEVKIQATNWIQIKINTCRFFFDDIRGLGLRKIKARVKHACHICHEIIEPGDHYCKIKSYVKLCHRCISLFPVLLRDGVQRELDALFNRLELETLHFLQDAEWRPSAPVPEDLV